MNDERGTVESPVSNGLCAQNEEQSEPHVGLFYVVEGHLYWEGIPTARGEGTADFKAYPRKHSTYWNGTLTRRLPALKEYDSYHFPRGRVVFDSKKDIYELMADKCILENSRMIEKIISEMGLPAPKVIKSRDSNYECAVCKSEAMSTHNNNWDIAINQQFKTTEDGGRLFFPWKSLWPWKRYNADVIPSDEEYARLRRRLSLRLKVGGPTTMFFAFLVFNRTQAQTGKLWMGLIMFFVSWIPFLIAHSLWLLAQCRGLKKTYEKY